MHVVVIAPGIDATRAVLSRLLAAPTRPRLLVLDYRGAAERVVDAATVALLRGMDCEWLDLADLARPTRLLDVTLDAAGLTDCGVLLRRWASVMGLPLRPEDTEKLAGFAVRALGQPGNARQTLPALRQALTSDEMLRWAGLGTAGRLEPDVRDRLIAVLDASLRYSHVAAAALAPVALPDLGTLPSRVAWLELDQRRMEEAEWRLLAMRLHAEVEATGRADPANRRTPVLLHPPGAPALTGLAPTTGDGDWWWTITTHPSGKPPHVLTHLVPASRRAEW